ncbi:tRNA adenosine(34) deaminase TadA [Candidatus Erwinia haradaeae]|uniref:tRNA-specific adenosine deaminase n=1 Tax=Candidatus Erwinia haradaeae TaxID=1922217 RepID=A0A803GC44_9GAMM|nr:tRNA adenosine(34) deaminase TadA [Candidatus Erwinia haradaeae]VFP87086.1 tRNA-specific adenosine deaminase [Candidatus Erwinia haradaeae]
MTNDYDLHWMQHALFLAYYAQDHGEIPIGSVLVLHNHLISKGWNQPIKLHDPTAHAEIISLREAGRVMKNYRLEDSTLYVTIAPCLMCVGAIIHSRVKRLVYGASNTKYGEIHIEKYIKTKLKINYNIQIKSGILEKECKAVLNQFFLYQRTRKSILT